MSEAESEYNQTVFSIVILHNEGARVVIGRERRGASADHGIP